jgi:hypothetical protein
MRRKIALAILFALFWPAQVLAQLSNDERTILAPVIASQALLHGGSRQEHICVEPKLFGAFESVQVQLKELPNATVYGAKKDEFLKQRREHLASGERDWRRYVPTEGSWTDNSPLPPGETAPLTAAVVALIGQDAPPVQGMIDPALIPALFHYGKRAGCSTLQLSAPAVHDDLAFVDTGYVCGGLCGFGLLYALRREQAAWRIVAVAKLWVS